MPYDIFISYAHQGDITSSETVAALVARLHNELEADFRHRFNRDLDIFFDKEDIQDFDHWQVRCHRALRDSRFFIAFLSRTYLRSDACRWEWEEWCRHELDHGLVGQGAASLWFVRLEDLEAPEDAALLRRWKGDLLQRFHIQCHEWRHDDHNNFLDAAVRTELQQLTEHVAQRLRLLTLDRARRGNLPWPNANFVGREPELASLRTALLDAPEQSPAGIHGIGGMGKTALAQAFVYKEADAFPGGCWLLRCEGRDRLLTVFRTLVTDLEIELTDEEKLDDAKAVRRVFEMLRARGPTLFLFDNVDRPALLAQDQMKLLADQPWARVLYTTRLAPDEFTKAGARIRPLDLDRLPENQAVDLIRIYQPGQAFASPEHEAAAREIVRELSGLTLAVETAAVYLGQCDPRTAEPQYAVYVRDYLSKLREDLKAGGSEGVMSQLREVTTTLRPTLARLDAPARTVLQIASLLAPDGVALPWVRAIAGQSHPELATDAATGESDPWTQLIRSLIGMRLFQPTAEPRVVAIHRILQRVLGSELLEDQSSAELIVLITELAEKRAKVLKESWVEPQNRWELEPFRTLAFLWMDSGRESGTYIGNEFGFICCYLCRYNDAEIVLRRALEIDEKNLGPNHPAIAVRLNNLAHILQETGRLQEAEMHMRRAIAVDEQQSEDDDIDLGAHLSNLGHLMSRTNRLKEAEEFYRRALAFDEVKYGKESLDVATDIHNLADLLRETNRVKEAEPLMRRALKIRERILGPSHPDVAASLNNLGRLFGATNRLHDAEMITRRALAIDECCFGQDHPTVAIRLKNLAQILRAAKRMKEAEPLVRRSLSIFENWHGSEHPRVAIALFELAKLLQATNRVTEVEPLIRRALAIDELSYGAKSPEVATDLHFLAQLLQDTNRLAEAESLMWRVLEIREREFPVGHSETLSSLEGLADLLEKIGKQEECKELRERFAALALQTKAVDPLKIRQLALRFFRLQNYERAEQLLRHLLSENFEPASTHHHLARICIITDRFSEAYDHVAQGWAARAEAKPYVIARLLWFQLALEFLESLNAALRNTKTVILLGRLKTTLHKEDVFMEWTMQPVLDHLNPKLEPQHAKLLTAFVAALNDRAKLPELDKFPEWRNATPQPLD
jgi:tetratricopeptide (TPR) repeat protein